MSAPDAITTDALPTGAGTMSPAMAEMQAYPWHLNEFCRDRVTGAS